MNPYTESIVIPELHQKFSLHNDDNEQGTMIRRNNSILLLSRTRTKAMVLQFQSLDDCLRFADRFQELNMPPQTPDLQSVPQETIAADRETVCAHLVQLLHEPSFRNLVRNIETTLDDAVDGHELLQAWVDQEMPRPRNHHD